MLATRLLKYLAIATCFTVLSQPTIAQSKCRLGTTSRHRTMSPYSLGSAQSAKGYGLSRSQTLALNAKNSFKRGDIVEAQRHLEILAQKAPQDADVRQFLGLVHFAKYDYKKAALEVYDALRFGSTWNWATIRSMYADTELYVEQLRSLERASKADKTSLSKHFLLAYHYLVLGHLESGEKHLEQVLTIRPDEPLTVRLLAVVQETRKNQNKQLVTTDNRQAK